MSRPPHTRWHATFWFRRGILPSIVSCYLMMSAAYDLRLATKQGKYCLSIPACDPVTRHLLFTERYTPPDEPIAPSRRQLEGGQLRSATQSRARLTRPHSFPDTRLSCHRVNSVRPLPSTPTRAISAERGPAHTHLSTIPVLTQHTCVASPLASARLPTIPVVTHLPVRGVHAGSHPPPGIHAVGSTSAG